LLDMAFKLDLMNYKVLPSLIQTNPFGKLSKEMIWMSLWCSLGYGSYYYKRADVNQIHNEFAILRAFSSINYQSLVNIPWSNIMAKRNLIFYFKHKLWATLRHLLVENINQRMDTAKRRRAYFNANWYKTRTANNWSLRVLETFLVPFSPGLFIYRKSLLQEEEALSQISYGDNEPSDKQIRWLIDKQPELPINSSILDWTDRRQVRRVIESYKHFQEIFDIFTDVSIKHQYSDGKFVPNVEDSVSIIIKQIFL
jgi:hypothetical protein